MDNLNELNIYYKPVIFAIFLIFAVFHKLIDCIANLKIREKFHLLLTTKISRRKILRNKDNANIKQFTVFKDLFNITFKKKTINITGNL